MNKIDFADLLRKERNEIWIRCADAAKTLSEPAQSTCQKWSVAADTLLTKAFDYSFPHKSAALFALGKLGSRELNLSSDVDILIVTNNDEPISPSELRLFTNLLAEIKSTGFVFRVDFDLRPGGRHGPLVPTLDQLKDYYGNYGETWERLAFLRLRPLCGDPFVQNEVTQFMRKFCFRRHLDFTLLEDLKRLRTKIQDHTALKVPKGTLHLKLGIGGIRDVELFTHALLIIHGGKDPDLQVNGTSQALELLKMKSLLPRDEAQFLQQHYWNLRTLENYVQALHDEQTHLIKINESSYPDFITQLLAKTSSDMVRCETLVRDVLGEAPDANSWSSDMQVPESLNDELQKLWQEILDKEVYSQNKQRDETARKSFLFNFLQALQEQQGNVPRGLSLLKDFIQGTRAKASFFTMLQREPALLKKIAWLFGHSPYLSRILCNRPELLDSFVFRAQQNPSADLEVLLEELAEKKLLSELINGSDFFEDKDIHLLNERLSSTADIIATTLLEALQREYDSSLEILALGKWGGRELGFRSDLDFIFTVPEEPTESDFKVAKRFISRLTEPHRGGQIYSIDMRLRPSGKAGPLVIAEPQLRSYLIKEAQAWERQAYLKARWIKKTDTKTLTEYVHRELTTDDLKNLEDIRFKLQTKGPVQNLKYDEGGLLDIELALQTSWLLLKAPPPSTSTTDLFSVWGPLGEVLHQNYSRLRQIEQTLQLVASESLLELRPNHESFQALALALHLPPETLQQEVFEIFRINRETLKELDPRRRAH